MAGTEWESFDRDRERAAIVGLALAQLPNEREVREGLIADYDVTFPELGESLEVLARLTGGGVRVSQRTFALQLLAKVARNRGTLPLAEVRNELRRYVHVSIEEGARLSELRLRREREVLADDRRRTAREEDRADGEVDRSAGVAPPPPPAEVEDGTIIVRSSDAPERETPAEPIGGPALGDDDPASQAIYDGLNACAGTTGAEGTAWEVFAANAQESLQLTDAEVNLPTCSDDEVVTVSGKAAFRVVTEFSSTEPVGKFLRWTDVRTWDTDCSLFYKSVKTVKKDAIPDEDEEYSELFLEIVRFSKNLTLETPLIFTRTIEVPDDPTRSATVYLLQFRLPKGVETDHIEVDSGSLMVRDDPDLKVVDLVAEKAISFKAPAMKNWPTLSCDLMWMEMSILAALGCVDKGT